MAFIPAAERYQLMHLIDRWVISTLLPIWSNQDWHCSKVQNWPSLYAVNLSGAINDEQFINFVQEQFALCRIHQSSALKLLKPLLLLICRAVYE